MRRRGLAIKFLTSNALLAIVSVGIIVLLLSTALPRLALHDAKERLTRQAKEIAEVLSPFVAEGRVEEVREWLDTVGEVLGAHICVFGKGGKPLIRACPIADSVPEAPRVEPSMFRSPRWSVERMPLWGEPVVQVSMPIPPASGGRAMGLLLIRQPLRAVREFQRAMVKLLLASMVAGLVLAALLSLLLYRSLQRSLAPLRGAIERASGGDLSVRLPVRSGDELGLLSASFNQLAERLEETIADLERERARVQAIFEAMADGVLSIGPDLKVQSANRAVVEMLGERPVGKEVCDLPRGRNLLSLIEEARSSRVSRWEEFQVGGRFVMANAAALPEGAGFVIVLRDISERKRMEEMRRQFLADVSHELRTPLSRAVAHAEVLLERAKDPETQRAAEVIHRELLFMRDLIADLLDLALLEAGAVALKLEEVDLLEVAEEAAERVAEEAKRKGVRVNIEVPEEAVVVADGARLLQVLTNLLDNAVRYNRRGGSVWVRAREVDGEVEISVEDTGPGIPPEERALVFERF
ncbi:MAG TPA: HAMP domain-containing protein, partial [Armatimonadetes bacterium]|nr:HAMP domain-containing protein [Armatimonadota bacterium]